MDAHRHEVFTAMYRAADAAPFTPARLVEIEGPAAGDPASTLARWARFSHMPDVFIGDGAVLYAEQILAANPAARVLPPPLIAGALGRLAIARRAEATDPAGVRPLYVRRPDAEIARDLASDDKTSSPVDAADTPEGRC
jgi:tRNA A37 threonylcarbamoyladenosine modification protein TsaB